MLVYAFFMKGAGIGIDLDCVPVLCFFGAVDVNINDLSAPPFEYTDGVHGSFRNIVIAPNKIMIARHANSQTRNPVLQGGQKIPQVCCRSRRRTGTFATNDGQDPGKVAHVSGHGANCVVAGTYGSCPVVWHTAVRRPQTRYAVYGRRQTN